MNAGYWSTIHKKRIVRRCLSKREHNAKMKESAELNAALMRLNPSFLEAEMMKFLDSHGIHYESQKIFYITAPDSYILQYFIADFYLPSKKIIIEVDGKFHKQQEKQDNKRTALIKQHYKGIQVIRLSYSDLRSIRKLRDLLARIK